MAEFIAPRPVSEHTTPENKELVRSMTNLIPPTPTQLQIDHLRGLSSPIGCKVVHGTPNTALAWIKHGSFCQHPPQKSHDVCNQIKTSFVTRHIGWDGVTIPADDTCSDLPKSAAVEKLWGKVIGADRTDVGRRIRDGRTLGMRAVELDESGNLSDAMELYKQALELLIPASKELENVHLGTIRQPRHGSCRVRREATVMLDRCEEISATLRTSRCTDETSSLSSTGPHPADAQEQRSSAQTSPHSRHGCGTQQRISPDPLAVQCVQSWGSALSSEIIRMREPTLTAAMEGYQLGGKRVPKPDEQKVAPCQPHHCGGKVAEEDSSKPDSVSHALVCIAEAAPCVVCLMQAEVCAPCGHKFCKQCAPMVASVFDTCPLGPCTQRLSDDTFTDLACTEVQIPIAHQL